MANVFFQFIISFVTNVAVKNDFNTATPKKYIDLIPSIYNQHVKGFTLI